MKNNKHSVMFTPCVGLKDLPPHDTMEAAFRAFHAEVTKACDKSKKISLQWIDSCWIKTEGAAVPYFFNDLIVLAHEKGWLKNGKLQKSK